MRCPHCSERVPLLGKSPDCPHCGRPLETQAGDQIRPIDLDYDAILAGADESSLRWTKRGALIAIAPAAISIIPGGGIVAFPFLVVWQFVCAGFLVARPYHRHFSPMRRLVTRWVRRLAMLFVVVPLHANVFVPFLGLVASPAVFFGSCWLVRAYARFHLVREKERRPVTWAEKLLVVVLAILVLSGLCVAGILIYLGVLVVDRL